MVIKRSEEELNAIRAVQFVRKVVDKNGNVVKNLYISDDGKFYDIDQYDSCDYFLECPEASFVKVKYDKKGRAYSNIDIERSESRNCQVARIERIMFDDGKYPMEHYRNLEIDHIDPRVPVKNCIENIEFVTHDENMRRAGETGVMIKKYSKELVGQICQMICDGKSRQEIINTLQVNGQFVDDIRAGRSHKSVSSQYLDKGFKYKTFDRYYRDDLLHKICKTIEEDPNMRVCDISRKLDGVDHRLISSIRNKTCYTRISKNYNF